MGKKKAKWGKLLKINPDETDEEKDIDIITFKIAFKVILLAGLILIAISLINGLFVYGQQDDIEKVFLNDNLYNFTGSYDEAFNIISVNGYDRVDKWEFALQSPDVLNPVGLDDPNGWSDWEGASDTVNIQTDTTNDRKIYMYSGSEDFGIERTDFDNTDKFRQDDNNINVTIEFKYTLAIVSTEVKTNLYIRSSDNTLIAQIRWYCRAYPDYIYRLEYYDGGSFQVLHDNMDEWIAKLEYNIGVNYTSETVSLRFSNATTDFYYSFDTITSGKAGLKAIEFKNTDGDGDTFPYISCGIDIDSIGFYSNEIPQTDEYAWKSVHLPSSWNMEHHNLLTTQFGGYGMVNYTDGIYQVGVTTLEDMLETQFFTNDVNTQNVYTAYTGDISDPYIIFYQTNVFFEYVWYSQQYLNITDFRIDGVKIEEEYTTCWLEYSYSVGYTDPFDNYFYVNTTTNSTNLYFTLGCQNSNLEYIQADFNIANKLSNDFGIGFYTYIESNALDVYGGGVFYLNFGDSTSWGLTFSGGSDSFHQIIPQSKTIITMTIVISDNDEDWQSGSTLTGYISKINMLYFPNAGISILTTNLLTMFIPLLVMITPTLAFYKKFGKKVIVPMLMLMSIICVATELIPYWLFFILMFSFIVFLFYTYKTGGME